MYQEQLYDKDRDHQGIYKNQSREIHKVFLLHFLLMKYQLFDVRLYL